MANSLAWINAVGSCTTPADDNNPGAGNSAANIDFAVVGVYIGRQFTAASSYTLCKVVLYLSQGTSTAATCEIWSDNGSNLPSAKIGTGSISLDLTAIGASKTPISFTGMSANIVSGTKYWVIVKSGNGKSGTFTWYEIATPTGLDYSSDDGITWFFYSNVDLDFTTYQ